MRFHNFSISVSWYALTNNSSALCYAVILYSQEAESFETIFKTPSGCLKKDSSDFDISVYF